MTGANRILNDRATEIQNVLNSGASSTSLNSLAAEIEADVVQIELGELGGDAERMAKLAAVLRGMAAQQ